MDVSQGAQDTLASAINSRVQSIVGGLGCGGGVRSLDTHTYTQQRHTFISPHTTNYTHTRVHTQPSRQQPRKEIKLSERGEGRHPLGGEGRGGLGLRARTSFRTGSKTGEAATCVRDAEHVLLFSLFCC